MDVSLDGLTLHVTDVERSVDFYRRLPGAHLAIHRPAEFALFEIGGTLLGLLAWRSPGFHLEMAAPDLDRLHDELVAAGIVPLGRPRVRVWGERTLELVDPDGHRIEVDSR
jgi:catechol 2,3-dioxygenase-like lactoylglutathione lyase family enzyme